MKRRSFLTSLGLIGAASFTKASEHLPEKMIEATNDEISNRFSVVTKPVENITNVDFGLIINGVSYRTIDYSISYESGFIINRELNASIYLDKLSLDSGEEVTVELIHKEVNIHEKFNAVITRTTTSIGYDSPLIMDIILKEVS